MTGSSGAIRKLVCVFALVSCLGVPLGATTIATGSLGPEAFNNVVDYRVVTKNGGNVDDLLTTFIGTGAVAGSPSTLVLTSSPYTLKLDNTLTGGGSITGAMLNLDFTGSVVKGTTTRVSCTGDGCDNYSLPTIVPSTYGTVITVISTSGTTYTWNYQMTSGPVSLNLLTAKSDFAADLAKGDDLLVKWTQTIGLTGTYTPPGHDAEHKCRDCTMVFSTSFNGSTTLGGTIEATLGQPDPSPVPEPSTGILLGVGIIGTAATLRRKLFPR